MRMLSCRNFAICLASFLAIASSPAQEPAPRPLPAPTSVLADVHVRSDTGFYKLVAGKYKLAFLGDTGIGGPFELIDDLRMMFVTRCGEVVYARLNPTSIDYISRAPLPNRDQVFCADDRVDPKLLKPLPNLLLYGVKNMKLDVARKRVFISMHSLMPGNCLVMKVFEYHFDSVKLKLSSGHEIFSSDVMVPDLSTPTSCPKIGDIVATQGGGAFALEPDGRLYFSIGDFGSYAGAQDPLSSYGKIFQYVDDKVSLFAKGVRNPQGLFYSSVSRQLFESEHGPKGGDEINLINAGDNLGWPISSYGIDYAHSGLGDFKPLSGQEKWGNHAFGKRPAFVYFPAIAPTGILAVDDSKMFADWNGSVIVSSLRGNSLFRVKIDGGRGMYSEPLIDLKERLRYVQFAPDGSILVKADPDVLFIVQLDAPGVRREDPNDTVASAFSTITATCKSCHLPHEAHGGIPNIYGIPEAKIFARLKEFAGTTGATSPMIGIAKSLSEDQIQALAKLFSTL